MRIVLLRYLAGEKYFEKDLLIAPMCRKWGSELTPVPEKKPEFSRGELSDPFSSSWTLHSWVSQKLHRNAWLWGLSQKLFLTHPKTISSLPERLWSQNINLSFFISAYTEFSPAPREGTTGSCCKLLCSSIHCTCPSVFARGEKAAPHQAGCLGKAGRWIAAKEIFSTPRAWSALSLRWVSWLASKTHLILLCEKAIF